MRAFSWKKGELPPKTKLIPHRIRKGESPPSPTSHQTFFLQEKGALLGKKVHLLGGGGKEEKGERGLICKVKKVRDQGITSPFPWER